MTKYYEEFIRGDIDEIEKFKFELKGELTIVISEKKIDKKTSQILSESDKRIINKMINKLTIKEITSLINQTNKIPKKIDWVLRIDGHTDKVPIFNERFNSNWHLSSARAINIVKLLVDNGIPPSRLVAAGFGEYSPLIKEENENAYKVNRRIEIKLTRR